MKDFFTHYSMEFGLTQGWNMVQNLADFAAQNEALYRESTALDAVEDGVTISVTEWDIFQLSAGATEELSETAKAFKEFLIRAASEEGRDPSDALMQSMHSGSSDYLTVKKILESK